jgi:hypothetical protein
MHTTHGAKPGQATPGGFDCLPTPDPITRTELDSLRASFTRKGYTLQRVHLVGSDQLSYHVTRTAHTRIFRSCQDLRSFAAVVEDSPV